MLTCRQCRATLPESDASDVARCRSCGALLDPIRGARPRVPLPRDLDVELAQGAAGRGLTLRWHPTHRVARVVVIVVILGALVAFARVAPPSIAPLLLAGTALLGAGMLFGALGQVHTIVDTHGIRRVTWPLSWKPVFLPRASVAQLYSRQERGDQTNFSVDVSVGGSSDFDSPSRRTSPPLWKKTLVAPEYATVFSVRAKTRDGRDHQVAGPFPQQEQALWVEQELERILRIDDTPVEGEVSRPS